MVRVLFHYLLYDVFQVHNWVLVRVLIKSVAELVSQQEADDEELLESGVGFVHDEVKGDLEEVVIFGVLHEFVLDDLDCVLVGGLGGVVVEELVDQWSELEGLLGR